LSGAVVVLSASVVVAFNPCLDETKFAPTAHLYGPEIGNYSCQQMVDERMVNWTDEKWGRLSCNSESRWIETQLLDESVQHCCQGTANKCEPHMSEACAPGDSFDFTSESCTIFRRGLGWFEASEAECDLPKVGNSYMTLKWLLTDRAQACCGSSKTACEEYKANICGEASQFKADAEVTVFDEHVVTCRVAVAVVRINFEASRSTCSEEATAVPSKWSGGRDVSHVEYLRMLAPACCGGASNSACAPFEATSTSIGAAREGARAAILAATVAAAVVA